MRAQVRGDLHAHSNWSDGGSPIEEMVAAARGLGHDYLALTDHSPRLTVANGLTAERLTEQLGVVAEINERIAAEGDDFRLLPGIEVDILEDRQARPDHGDARRSSTSSWRACTRSCGPTPRR